VGCAVDRQEFGKAALSELAAVYRLAYHLAPRADDADDLVQETYLRAFKSADRFRPAGHGLRPWLFKILNNVLRERLRSGARRPVVLNDLGALAERGAAARAGRGHTGAASRDVEIEWEQVDERLKSAIGSLPLDYRVVFLLFAVERLKYREIACVLDLPVGTVMSRLHRAREMLLEQLPDVAAERGAHPAPVGANKTRHSGI
jgi:RNA polymerase sigma-70 factor (ECF subfamily)